MKSKLLVGIIIFILIFIAPVQTSYAQPEGPAVKIEAIQDSAFPNVEAYVSVTDPQGFPIKDLTADKFDITEGGVPVGNATITPIQNTTQPLAIVIVMDTSGSMYGAPLQNSVNAAKTFINTLIATDQVSVVQFADQATVLQGLTLDRPLINSALDSLTAVGDTAMYDGLIEGIGLLKTRSERRVIILLTDGQENKSQFTEAQVLDEAARWSIPIYPIGFGGVDKNQLQQLAKLTGGYAQINPDSSTIDDAFQNVLNLLREQYLVRYSSSFQADGLEHELKVNVTYPNGYGFATRNFVARPNQVTISIKDLTNGMVTGGNVPLTALITAPAPVKQVEILLDSQPLNILYAAPFETIWNSTTVTPGTHTIEMVATDSAGNSGKTQVDLQIRPPVLMTWNITDGETIVGQKVLQPVIDSLSKIASVEYFVDNTSVGIVQAEPFELAWDSRTVTSGIHNLSARATDVNGFTGEVKNSVNIELRSGLLWIALLATLLAAGIIIPFAVRSRKRRKSTIGGAVLGDQPSQQASGYFLVEVDGLNPGVRWPLSADEIRIGRKRDENDIPLKGVQASRHQAVLRYENQTYVLYSLNPENPMLVNGSPSMQAVLNPGDTLQAGETTLKFGAGN